MFTGASGDLDVYIPEVWGSLINDFAKEDTPATNFFTDRSSELADGGDTVHTGNLTEMTAYAKSSATAVTLKELGANLIVRLKHSIIELCLLSNVQLAV